MLHALMRRARACAGVLWVPVLLAPSAHADCIPDEGLEAAREATRASRDGAAGAELADAWFRAARLFDAALASETCRRDPLLIYNTAEAFNRGLAAQAEPDAASACRAIELYDLYREVGPKDELQTGVATTIERLRPACRPVTGVGEAPDAESDPLPPGEVADAGREPRRPLGDVPVTGVSVRDPGPRIPPLPPQTSGEPDSRWLVGAPLVGLAVVAAAAGGYFLLEAVDSVDAARAVADGIDCDATATHAEARRRFESHREDAEFERRIGLLGVGAGLAIGGVAAWWFWSEPDPVVAAPSLEVAPAEGAWRLNISGRF